MQRFVILFLIVLVLMLLDTDGLQIQLSLSMGGLGLCRLALHCVAAYLASVNKASFSAPLDEFTLQAVTLFNRLVPLASAVSVESLLYSGLSQNIYLPELMTINLTSCGSS